jgi:hypothetical protein
MQRRSNLLHLKCTFSRRLTRVLIRALLLYLFVLSSFYLYQNPFHLILHSLPHQLLCPRHKCIVPALRVECHHDLFRKAAFVGGFDDIPGGVEYQALFDPGFLPGYFITEAYAPAIPAAAGVGEIEDFIEIQIKIGLAEDAEIFIVCY